MNSVSVRSVCFALSSVIQNTAKIKQKAIFINNKMTFKYDATPHSMAQMKKEVQYITSGQQNKYW